MVHDHPSAEAGRHGPQKLTYAQAVKQQPCRPQHPRPHRVVASTAPAQHVEDVRMDTCKTCKLKFPASWDPDSIAHENCRDCEEILWMTDLGWCDCRMCKKLPRPIYDHCMVTMPSFGPRY